MTGGTSADQRANADTQAAHRPVVIFRPCTEYIHVAETTEFPKAVHDLLYGLRARDVNIGPASLVGRLVD